MIRVFLLDDHEVVRRGCASCSRAPTTSKSSARPARAEEALRGARDVGRCRRARRAAARRNRDRGVPRSPLRRSELRCLMLTSFNDDEALFDAIMAGASGYVLKEVRGAISSERSAASPRASRCSIRSSRPGPRTAAQPAPDDDRLATHPAGVAILGHLADGLTNREIAERCTSPRRRSRTTCRTCSQAGDEPSHAGGGVRSPTGRTRQEGPGTLRRRALAGFGPRSGVGHRSLPRGTPSRTGDLVLRTRPVRRNTGGIHDVPPPRAAHGRRFATRQLAATRRRSLRRNSITMLVAVGRRRRHRPSPSPAVCSHGAATSRRLRHQGAHRPARLVPDAEAPRRRTQRSLDAPAGQVDTGHEAQAYASYIDGTSKRFRRRCDLRRPRTGLPGRRRRRWPKPSSRAHLGRRGRNPPSDRGRDLRGSVTACSVARRSVACCCPPSPGQRSATSPSSPRSWRSSHRL